MEGNGYNPMKIELEKLIEENKQLKKRKSKARIRFFDDYPLMRRYWSWLMK